MQKALARLLSGVAALLRPAAPKRNEQPPTIGVVCNSFLRYGCEQAIGLAATGASVTLYYVDRLEDFAGIDAERQQYLDRVHDAGVTIVSIPRRQAQWVFRDLLRLHRTIRANHTQALIVHAHVDPRLAFLGLRFQAALFVHDPAPHSGDYESQFPWPLRAIARFSEASAAMVLVHSNEFVTQLNSWIDRGRVGVVPHGAVIAANPPAVSSPPRLLIIGRLMHYKGVDVALDAFPRIRTRLPSCELVIAGRGELAGTVRDRALDGVTLIERYISEDEITGLIRSARLVLLPYRDASQSGVGLIATGLGVPCIVTRSGALPELVPEGHENQVIEAADPDALASAILVALDHDARHREETLRHASTKLAWPIVGRAALGELQRLRLLR